MILHLISVFFRYFWILFQWLSSELRSYSSGFFGNFRSNFSCFLIILDLFPVVFPEKNPFCGGHRWGKFFYHRWSTPGHHKMCHYHRGGHRWGCDGKCGGHRWVTLGCQHGLCFWLEVFASINTFTKSLFIIKDFFSFSTKTK